MTAQPGMFGAPEPEEVQFSEHFAAKEWQARPSDRVSWSKYSLRTHVQCEECVWLVHEESKKLGRLSGRAIAAVRWKRVLDQGRLGKREMLLCYSHGQEWKTRDGR